VGAEVCDIIDTPGVNALEGVLSEDEEITRRILGDGGADLVVQIADARNLRRALMLTWQIARIGKQMILVLNMADEARAHGIEIGRRRAGAPAANPGHRDGRGGGPRPDDLRHALTRAPSPRFPRNRGETTSPGRTRRRCASARPDADRSAASRSGWAAPCASR